MAFDDRGSVESVDFDYDAIDANLGLHPEVDHPNRRDETLVARAILSWVMQKVPRNNNGIEIRAVVVSWLFLPHLKAKSMTEIAAMIGKDKQSLGRWVDDFKKRFPGVYRNLRHSLK